MEKPKLIIVAGPTAIGKTDYAINLAKNCDGEIVSLDTVQVYKGLNIGSAKPSEEQLKEVPHYMIDEVDPSVNLNVKDFKDLATKYINDILDRKKQPILVGGSGFYIDAVLFDTEFLYEDENESNKIRQELELDLKDKGVDYLYEELKKVDEKALSYIPKENTRRVIRAIEFYRLHGMPISIHNENERNKECKYDYTYNVLCMDRNKLYERINHRVDLMIRNGLLSEVKSLINKGYNLSLNSMNSIGYKELYYFCRERDEIKNINNLDLDSKKELDKLIEEIKMHSRNYAKRQMTWFRSKKNIKKSFIFY